MFILLQGVATQFVGFFDTFCITKCTRCCKVLQIVITKNVLLNFKEETYICDNYCSCLNTMIYSNNNNNHCYYKVRDMLEIVAYFIIKYIRYYKV